MKKYFLVALLLSICSTAQAVPYARTTYDINTPTATQVLSGNLYIYASTNAATSSPLIQFLGTNNGSAIFGGSLNVGGPETIVSTLTVKGNAFSVGTSTLVVVGGNIGIGTTAPQQKLHVQGTIVSSQVFVGATQIDAAIAVTGSSKSPFQIVSDGNNFSHMIDVGTGTNALGGSLSMFKTRSTGSDPGTIVHNLDTVGIISFYAADGTSYDRNAAISATVDGTPGLADMPGALHFFTALDNTTTLSERLTIRNNGLVGVGTTNPSTTLDVNGSATIRGQQTVTSTLTVQGNFFSVGDVGGGFGIIETTGSINSSNFGVGIGRISGTANLGGRYSLDVFSNSGFDPSLTSDIGHVRFSNVSDRELVFGLSANSATEWIQTKNHNNTGVSYLLALNPLGGNVGVGTLTPQTALDINGAAQFGAGSTKSTFTASGSLIMSSTASITVPGSSVTANSFYGDGSHLTGIGNGISSTTTAGQGGFNFTTTQAAFSLCATTLTITTNGGPVAVWFSGAGASSQVTLSTIGLSVLQDGAFVSGYSSSVGFSAFSPTINTQEGNLGFYNVIAAPASGTHSYCLTAKISGGTFSFDQADTAPQFGVKETQ